MQAPVTNPTPKSRFQLSPQNLTKHREMVDSGEFQRAMDFGLLEYTAQLGLQTKDGNSAAATGLKLQGALEFMQTVRMLSETTRVSKPVAQDNLTETN